jgi:hypothetical protein
MTFTALRRAALQATALSTSFFAENVTLKTRAGATSTIRAKIEYDTKPKRTQNRPLGAQQTDESQRIRVMVSRETDWSGSGLARTPYIGDTLTRASAVDPDTRPWIYAGEIVAESTLHAVYIFERARRQYDARRTLQE